MISIIIYLPVLIKELVNIHLILYEQLRQVLYHHTLEDCIICVLEQVLDDVEERSIQVVVQTFLDERLVVPVGHEVHPDVDLEELEDFLKDLAAVLLLFVGLESEHLVQCRVLSYLRVIDLYLKGMYEILDGVLE